MEKVPKDYILILFIFGLRLCFNEYGYYGAWLGLPMAGWAVMLYYDFYYKKGQQKNGDS